MRANTPLTPNQKALLEKAHSFGINEVELMNRLQNLGLVSDNATWLHECADSDCKAAISRAPWSD